MPNEVGGPTWEELRGLSKLDYELAHITQPIPIATGTPLDHPLGGGIPVGTFTVIGGEPGTGKSALAIMAAYFAAKAGRHPIYFSMEMPAQMVVSRMLSIHSFMAQVERGYLDPRDQVYWSKTGEEVERNLGGIGPRSDMLKLDEQSRYIAAMHYARDHGEDDLVLRTWRDFRDTIWPRMAVVDNVTSVEQACQWTAAVAYEGMRPFPIVDYLQLGIGGEGSEYELVSAASRLLAHTCKQWNLPMLVLSSLRKIGAKEHDDAPQLSWFKGSNAIVYDAGTAIVLTRDGPRDETSQARVMAHIIKNRVGKLGEAPMLFTGSANWFSST